MKDFKLALCALLAVTIFTACTSDPMPTGEKIDGQPFTADEKGNLFYNGTFLAGDDSLGAETGTVVLTQGPIEVVYDNDQPASRVPTKDEVRKAGGLTEALVQANAAPVKGAIFGAIVKDGNFLFLCAAHLGKPEETLFSVVAPPEVLKAEKIKIFVRHFLPYSCSATVEAGGKKFENVISNIIEK